MSSLRVDIDKVTGASPSHRGVEVSTSPGSLQRRQRQRVTEAPCLTQVPTNRELSTLTTNAWTSFRGLVQTVQSSVRRVRCVSLGPRCVVLSRLVSDTPSPMYSLRAVAMLQRAFRRRAAGLPLCNEASEGEEAAQASAAASDRLATTLSFGAQALSSAIGSASLERSTSRNSSNSDGTGGGKRVSFSAAATH